VRLDVKQPTDHSRHSVRPSGAPTCSGAQRIRRPRRIL